MPIFYYGIYFLVLQHFVTTADIDEIIVGLNTTHLTNASCRSNILATKFNGWEKSIISVEKDAFSECKELKIIGLEDNRISFLHEDTFKQNIKLEELYLSRNQLEFLEEDLFVSLINLRWLSIASNLLRFFPATLIRNQKYMTDLYLECNQIMEINERQLTSYAPNLAKLNIDGNDLLCNRVEQIVKTFQEKNVKLNKIDSCKSEMKMDIRYGIKCISNEKFYKAFRLQSQNGQIAETSLSLAWSEINSKIDHDQKALNEEVTVLKKYSMIGIGVLAGLVVLFLIANIVWIYYFCIRDRASTVIDPTVNKDDEYYEVL